MYATLETYFQLRIFQAIQSIRDQSMAKGVASNPHLWPLFLFGNGEEEFYIPSKGKKPQVYAYLNHGRWLTRCPFCPSSQHASDTDHWFLCAMCGKEQQDKKLKSLPVVWPDSRVEIENMLAVRDVINRNWLPGETVQDLFEENKKNGVM